MKEPVFFAPLLIVWLLACGADPASSTGAEGEAEARPPASDAQTSDGVPSRDVPPAPETDSGASDEREISTPGEPTSWPHVEDLIFAANSSDALTISGEGTCYGDIQGDDPSGYNWDAGLETGAPVGELRFYFEGGSEAQRSVRLVDDPEEPTNTVLYTRIDRPNVETGQPCDTEPMSSPCAAAEDTKARIQMVLRDNTELRHFNYQVRLRLGPGFGALKDAAMGTGVLTDSPLVPAEGLSYHWLTIGEFWNNLANEDYPFRITLGALPKAGEGLRLTLKADKRVTNPDGSYSWEHLWEEPEPSADFDLPIERWFTLHLRIVEGDETTGKTVLSRVTPDGNLEPLIDVTGVTQHPDEPEEARDGFKDINPIKIYTSGQLLCGLHAAGLPLDIWWDDFAIGGGNE